MYGGARDAAISPDEEWCVVVGCGFRVRRLRLAAEFRSHGADPANILWLNRVEAVGGHMFRLHGGGPGYAVREYLYDADTDVMHLDREWVDEGRRVRTEVLKAFVGQPLDGVDVTHGQTVVRFGTSGELHFTIAHKIRLEHEIPGRGVGTLDLDDEAQLAQAKAVIEAWRGIWVAAVTIDVDTGIRFQMSAKDGAGRPPMIDWFGITAPLSSPGAWSVSTPIGRLDAPSGPAVASRSR
jgi:hypothetical protein